MSAFLRAAWAVFWKDLLVERRAKEGANALGFFAILLLFLFYFALHDRGWGQNSVLSRARPGQ